MAKEKFYGKKSANIKKNNALHKNIKKKYAVHLKRIMQTLPIKITKTKDEFLHICSFSVIFKVMLFYLFKILPNF